MLKIRIYTITILFISLFSIKSYTFNMNSLQGYKIVAVKTIIGYVDENKVNNDFEGCDYDKVIVFDDNTALTCKSYHYHYSYRPQATILYNGSSWKMIVDNEVYDMSNY